MDRLDRKAWPRNLGRWAGLLIFAGVLTVGGFWLDQQFAADRGPLRPVGAQIVVWVSLAAVGLVLILWLVALFANQTKPRE